MYRQEEERFFNVKYDDCVRKKVRIVLGSSVSIPIHSIPVLSIIKQRAGPDLSSPCQNISLYEPEQSLSLSQDEGEQC